VSNAAYQVATHASGAEIWSHPPHCPAWRTDRELFTYWPGCAGGCDKGRRWKHGAAVSGGSFTVQCVECWAAHEKHPATVEEYRARVACASARATWARRMEAEAERRAGKRYGVDDAGVDWIPIRDAVLADGPPEPTGEVVPEFPEGWAPDPGTRRGAGRKRRKG